MSEKPTLNDVMYAILAIDAYFRGNDFEKAFSEVDGTEFQKQVGQATVRDQRGESLQGADIAGFNASAYDLDGGLVISYRGTDFIDGVPNLSDVGFGWTGSMGFSLADLLEPVFEQANGILENILGVQLR